MSDWEQFSQYIINGLTTGAIYALAALDFYLIYNVTHIVNFAQGDIISLGALAGGSAGRPAHQRRHPLRGYLLGDTQRPTAARGLPGAGACGGFL